MKDVVHKLTVKLWNVYTMFCRAGKFINHPKISPLFPYMELKLILTTKSTLFNLLFIGTLGERKQDTPHHEPVLFHPFLKTYPTCHS